jgi:LemA protein
VDSQWAQVDNVYQRRADLIPNLVKTVEGAANFEKSTLTEITAARASVGQIKLTGAPDAQQLAEFEKAQSGLGAALSRLLVVSEKYPDLKANQGFLSLQTQLEGSENRIAVERGRYNEVVQDYNTRVLRFPTVFIARLMGFTERAYFKSSEGADKPPEVKFDFGSKKPS